MKKIILCLLAACSVLVTSGCGILSDMNNTVEYPDAYSITYEVTNMDGVVTTLSKTVDKDGNVYVKAADLECLYIKEGNSYQLYEKEENGTFVSSGDERYTRKAVDSATSQIDEYAKESLKQFMPTAKKEGKQEVAGRSCQVYKLGVGGENNSAYYYYFVDEATGICLGVNVRYTALGQEVANSENTFICTNFETENVQPLAEKYFTHNK